MPIHDLTTAQGVVDYLRSKLPVQASSAAPLSGGYVGYVWRVELAVAYEGYSSVVVKHAQPHTSGNTAMPIAVERLGFEVQALALLGEVTAQLGMKSRVKLPKLLYSDLEEHVIVMEDAGNLLSLKSFLSLPPSPTQTSLASEIGTGLGQFLAHLHTIGRGNDKLKEVFTKNATARRVCANRTAGRLVTAAEKYLSPGERKAEQIESLGNVRARIMKDTLEGEETFNMGDFW